MKKIKLNFSTCPNDTFMFDALVNGKIDTHGLEFDVTMADIEVLNATVLKGEVDVSKISYAVYPSIADCYRILSSGSAIGYGSGPLLVAKHPYAEGELRGMSVALPGEHTTAARLMQVLYPEVGDKHYALFSDVSAKVLSGETDLGVLIHEERFTYAAKGLYLVSDLGEQWEGRFSLPIPLGGIVVNRSLAPRLQGELESLIEQSVRYALANPLSSREFVRQHAKELSDEVIDKHIAMFVNDFSVNIGSKGSEAIKMLFKV